MIETLGTITLWVLIIVGILVGLAIIASTIVGAILLVQIFRNTR